MYSKKIDEIIEYIKSEIELGENEVNSINKMVSLIDDYVPTDLPLIFRRLDSIISATGDISWTLAILKKHRAKINAEYKQLKDPQFTSLTRKGRPSAVAIESEIRFNVPEVAEYEQRLEVLDGFIEYIEHLLKISDSMQWAIKDRVALSKI